MIYLYWFVVIIGIFVIPVVAGTMYAKAMKRYEAKQGYRRSSYRPEVFNYVISAFTGMIALFAWPFALPLGCIAGAFYLLFKAPKFILDRKAKK